LKNSQSPESSVNVKQKAVPPEGGGGDNTQASAAETEAKRKRTLALSEYGNLAQRATLFQQRRNELLVLRKPGDSMLVALDRQISDVHKRLLDLAEIYPDLFGKQTTAQSGPSIAPV
jgi:hypothetical protein